MIIDDTKKVVPEYMDPVMEQMLISSLRYALGRRSYIVELTIDAIASRIELLSTYVLVIMCRDLQDYLRVPPRSNNPRVTYEQAEIQNQWLWLLSTIETKLQQREEGSRKEGAE